jgi:hypothetical protein
MEELYIFSSSGKRREPTLLCEEKLCEILQYIGLHCTPSITRGSELCWLYCFIIESSDSENTFRKIILEKEQNTLVARFPPYVDCDLLLDLFKVCFNMRNQPLIDVRRRMRTDTGIFVYDSTTRFINGIRSFACDSYRIVKCCDPKMFYGRI